MAIKITNEALIALTEEELKKKLEDAYKKGYSDAKAEGKKTVSKSKTTLKSHGKEVLLRNTVTEEATDE
ncbi:MAG: hypothetical protein U0K83_04890 [Bacteroidales bacterium]|nr:hypothetical protein [Bacteroidales bacterium]